MCALCVFNVLGRFPSAWCRMIKAEQETIVRWDREDRRVDMWTADPAQARHWTRNGYDVTAVVTTTDGRTTGWRTVGPTGCIRFRRVRDGVVVKRVGGAQNLAVHGQVSFSRRGEQAVEPIPEAALADALEGGEECA